MTKIKPNKNIQLSLITEQNKTYKEYKIPGPSGKKGEEVIEKVYEKVGDIKIEIDNKPIAEVKHNLVFSYIFDDIKDLESKNTDILDLLDTINNRLLGLESRVDVLEGN
jgi:hypothetical protein